MTLSLDFATLEKQLVLPRDHTKLVLEVEQVKSIFQKAYRD